MEYLESSQETEIKNSSESQVLYRSENYGILLGENECAPDRNRTCNLRFRRTAKLRCKVFQNVGLRKAKKSIGLNVGLKVENLDPDLRFILSAWSKLSLADKKNSAAIVRAFLDRKN